MPLRLTVDKAEFDALPEAAQNFYAEKDGRFVLDAEGVEDTSGLKSALQRERDERKAAKEALKAFEGIDPEEARSLLTNKKKAEEDALKQAGKWEEMKSQIVSEWEKKLDPLAKERDRYRAAVDRYLIDAQATAAIAEHKGVPALLLPHVKQHIRVVEENGEFVARVVDANGNPRIGDAQGNPMTISQLVERDFKQNDIFGRAFEASGAAGSGAPAGSQAGGAGGKKQVKRADFDAMAPNERMAFIKAGGVPVD